jgi:hypothetical protein
MTIEALIGDDGADNADHNVANECKTVALDDEAREPAGNRANHQPNGGLQSAAYGRPSGMALAAARVCSRRRDRCSNYQRRHRGSDSLARDRTLQEGVLRHAAKATFSELR